MKRCVSMASQGYMVHLLFYWLNNVELAKERVADRVASGGHNIPIPVIERRYKVGIKNLFELFMNEVDIWTLYDNTEGCATLIAYGGKTIRKHVKNIVKFEKIQDYE